MTTRAHKLISLLKYLRFIVFIGALAYSNVAISQTDTVTIPAKEYVTGIVRDAITKEPVAAAQIKTLSNSAAATTNEKGYFNIEIISNTDILLVIAIDYNAIELPIKGRNNLEIELYRDVFSLFYNEYENISGLKRASFNTNSASKIEYNGDPSVVVVDNILQANMGGEIRGISRSGLSGIGSSLFIRGLNSINLNAQPLFVVDGVLWNSFSEINSLHDGFYNNPLTDIDPNDIESITIVKDGTSLYGSKGGNGVVLIKTKRGVDVSTKIMINMSAGVNQSPSSYPLMNGDQFRLYSSEMLSSIGYSPQSINSMPFLMTDTTSASYKTFHNSTGWEDEIYKMATFQSYNISVNGGDEKALYAFSMGYTGNKGNINKTNMQRLNTRFNADFFLTDKIDMGLNIGFTNIDRNLLDDGVNFYTSPSYLAMIKSEFLNPYSYTNSGTLTGDFEDSDIFGVGNPVAVIENSLNYNKQYRLNMGLKPKIQITPEFSISNQFDYSLFKVKEAHYDPIVGTAEKYIEGYGISQNLFQNQIIRNNNFFNDFRLMYNPNYGQYHRINSMAGIRYLSDSFTSDYAEGHNSGSDQKRNLQTDEDFKYLNGTNKNINSLSYYVNVDYSFDNRYMVTAAISVDGSSRFGRETENGFQLFDHSWGVFPSINAAWLASSEPFMANIPYIDLLKFRAGYGITGNDDIEPYAYSAYFSPIRFMNRANGLYISNIGNSQIQWETTSKINFGFDLNTLNNRLALSFDLYSNTTDNLLHLNILPEVAGSGAYWANGGEITNKGIELNLKAIVLNLSKLQWEVGASIGHYKNSIVSLPDGDFTNSIYNAEILSATGNAAGVFYGYKTNGVFSTADEATAANLKIVTDYGYEYYFRAGDMHFSDMNSDGIIDENDKQIIGDPNPDFYGSLSSKLTYGNFSFSAICTYSYGNDVYNYLRSNLESGKSFNNQSTAMLNRWTYEGQQTNMPKAEYGDFMGNSRFSDRWIEDGSYFRVKSLSISYKIPINLQMFDQVHLWASANNLLTLTNYLGRDPEVSVNNAVLYQGIDTGLMPLTRSFNVGLKLNL